jgi:hypothetical protein
MNEDVIRRMDAKVAGFQSWMCNRKFRDIRVVQYCGVELVGANNIAPEDAVDYVRPHVYEGFHVDWCQHGERIYLRVWEPWYDDDPEPGWPLVFAELPPADRWPRTEL